MYISQKKRRSVGGKSLTGSYMVDFFSAFMLYSQYENKKSHICGYRGLYEFF